VVVGLWWGPFGYAMYLSQVVVRGGDPRLLKRGIRGTAPYETDCRICAPGYGEGATVRVAVAPRNHKRVTIDPGQSGHAIQAALGGHRGAATAAYTSADGGALPGQPPPRTTANWRSWDSCTARGS
jgi:hypothetical protein